MFILQACVQYIDAFTDRSGRLLAWLALGMALLMALIVIMRYGFNAGSIMAQESVTYMHACLFMLGGAYALKSGAHVRVDIFYRNFSPRTKAWVNSLGGILFDVTGASGVVAFVLAVVVAVIAGAVNTSALRWLRRNNNSSDVRDHELEGTIAKWILNVA